MIQPLCHHFLFFTIFLRNKNQIHNFWRGQKTLDINKSFKKTLKKKNKNREKVFYTLKTCLFISSITQWPHLKNKCDKKLKKNCLFSMIRKHRRMISLFYVTCKATDINSGQSTSIKSAERENALKMSIQQISDMILRKD